MSHSTSKATRLLLTADEAAKALSISPRNLWSLTNSERIPHVRIGRSVRYSVHDLEQWVAQRTNGGPAANSNS